MTLMIELDPELERRLKDEARRAGLTVSEYAQRLLDEALPGEAAPQPQIDPTIALFQQWEREDATTDPAELARREKEWEEFKAQMNQTRDEVGARRIFK